MSAIDEAIEAAWAPPLSGIEAVEREMVAVAPGFPFDAATIQKWAARLKAEREKIQKLLSPDPRIEVIEPYDFRLYAAMEQIRILNLERERLEPFLKAAAAHFRGGANYAVLLDSYLAMASETPNQKEV